MVVPLRLAFVSLAVAFGGSFHFGYLTFLLNPSHPAFYSFVHQSFAAHYGRWLVEEEYRLLWSCLSAALPLGAIIGVLVVASLGDDLSRKRVMYMAVCLSVTGSMLSLLSQPCDSFELYILGRFTS
uniref:Major facilitator superfamily (MFS) profile domain-containing protein n=1 Tax=Plectus sambesii TaxID=2011161 RepID=A0A914UYV0_9BILA